ncbi:MAG: DNA-directed RNA polymerase subunit alpha [Candidatus Liptonbacteria bacterium]|nr:DNA-directed RNA polymerase subunit alpha [Candidatus Liptonbacteria bacterium]
MELIHLSEGVTLKTVSETDTEGVFEIEGLYTGYGLTIGNALRRTLLSSLPGAAVTQIKIKGAGHEFTTIEGVLEDMVEIALNLKKVRFVMHTNEPQVLSLKVKGEKNVTAADIKGNSQVELVSPDAHIATLTAKGAELDMELTVERGLGYLPVDARKMEKLPIGTIAIDAMFSPVIRVTYSVENMRVGERTDYNRLRITIATDGTITPSAALHKSANILTDHFGKISVVEVRQAAAQPAAAEAKPKRKRATKKKEDE